MEEKKSRIVTLQAGNERLQFNAIAGKGGVSFYVLQQEVGADKKVKTVGRGGSKKFETMAEASKAVDEGVAEAVKAGWAMPARVGGAIAQPKADTFQLNSLPKPKGGPAPAPAPKAQQKGGASAKA